MPFLTTHWSAYLTVSPHFCVSHKKGITQQRYEKKIFPSRLFHPFIARCGKVPPWLIVDEFEAESHVI